MENLEKQNLLVTIRGQQELQSFYSDDLEPFQHLLCGSKKMEGVGFSAQLINSIKRFQDLISVLLQLILCEFLACNSLLRFLAKHVLWRN